MRSPERVRDNNDYCYSTFRETGCTAGCRHPDDRHDAARHIYRCRPLLDTIRQDYGLSTAQNRPAHNAAPACLRLYLSPCRRRRPAPGHGAQPFYRSAADLHRIGVRSLPSAALLFIGTAIVGCGIALGNVLLPGLIKRDFPGQVAKLTGAYSLTMGAAAAAGSALIVPLSLGSGGWHGALLMLMFFPLVALLLWLPQWRQRPAATPDRRGRVAQPGYLALGTRLAGDAFSGH